MIFKNTKLKLDKAALNIVLWNITPYFGVYFLHWEPMSVLICYALETIVIGVFNVFKMIAVYWYGMPETDPRYESQGILSIPFFILNYGLMVFVQLYIFFGIMEVITRENRFTIFDAIRVFMSDETTNLALTLFVVFNAYDFVTDFLLNREFTRRTLRYQVFEPIPRVIALQAVVIAGAVVFANWNNGFAILTSLTVIKIILEIVMRSKSIKDLNTVES